MIPILVPTIVYAVLAVALPGSTVTARTTAPADSVVRAIEDERAETLRFFRENLHSPLAAVQRADVPKTGWLTIGSASDNAVVLDDVGVRPHHARVSIDGPGFRVECLDEGAVIRVGKEEERSAGVGPSFVGIGRYDVRLSYQNAPAVIVFDPLAATLKSARVPTWYPVDARYRYVLKLVEDGRQDTVWIESTHGRPRPSLRVGRFEFRLEGRDVRLAAYRLLEPGVRADDVGLYFRDRTAGQGSYPVGRYLDVERQADGRYVVDFNRAYSPSCAYSPYYNCPIPPPENRISVSIPAGESWPKTEAP